MEGNDASFKYEELYLHNHETVAELRRGLEKYFAFYNDGRYHQSLGYRTPRAVYEGE